MCFFSFVLPLVAKTPCFQFESLSRLDFLLLLSLSQGVGFYEAELVTDKARASLALNLFFRVHGMIRLSIYTSRFRCLLINFSIKVKPFSVFILFYFISGDQSSYSLFHRISHGGWRLILGFLEFVIGVFLF